MAYRPDDPYNIGNINTGQVPVNNIELAKTFNTRQGLLDIGAAEKGTVYGYNPTVVGDFIGTSKKLQGSQNPVTGGGDIGSIKTWMTDPKRQHIYEDYLDKSGTQFIPEIQKALEQGLFENRDDFGNQLLYEEAIKNKGDQAFLDDEYDFSEIADQTAMLGLPQLFGMITKGGISKQAIKKALIRDQISKQIGKKVKPVLTGILTDGKAAAAAPTSHKEAQATGGDYHSDTRSTVDGQTTEWGDELFSRGGLAQYAPRGSYFDGGLASLWLR